MVGVAGRSKGCNTCRKRKKGCDLQRPACQRCLKAGLVCTGYERERVFIHFPSSEGEKPQPTAEVRAVSTPPPEDVTLHPSLTRSAREVKYISMFWDSYIPERRRFLQTLAKYSYANCWVPSMRRLQQTDSALHKIMIALCVGTIGLDSGEEWMRREGSKLYLSALQDMNVGLQTPARRNSDALLLASRVFGLYDLICGSDDGDKSKISPATSWRGHNLGQLGLILQRRPHEFVDGISHSLFVEGRMTMSMMSIVIRKRTALCTPEWKTVPFTKIPKTSKDMIFDIMGDVSGLFEDFDRASTLESHAERQDQYLLVAGECWNVDCSLSWWYENIAPKTAIADLIERNFEDPTPEDVAVAYIMSHYWTACVLLYSTLRLTLAACSATDALLCLPERADPRIYCKHIVDATEVLHHQLAGAFGAHAQVFPLSMAAAYLLATEGGLDGCSERSPATDKMFSFFEKGDMGTRLKGLLSSMFRSTGIPVAGDDGKRNEIEQMALQARAWFGMDKGEGLEAIVRRLLW